MPTLDELMADVLGASSQEQTKTASAKPATTQEIDQVLEGLGLGGSEAVKTASANLNDNGGNMKGSLTDLLYNDIMGEGEASANAQSTTEKTASEAASSDEGTDAAFGEAAGHYFNAAYETYLDKVAASLEAEASHNTGSPMGNLPAGSSVSKSLGLGKDTGHMDVNHKDALKHEPIASTTKNHGAYDEALKNKYSVLRRIKGLGIIGEQKV